MKSMKEQEAIITGAMPGPWLDVSPTEGGYELMITSTNLATLAEEGDYQFIQESRTEWPELLAWAKRARSYLESLYVAKTHLSDDGWPELKELLEELPE